MLCGVEKFSGKSYEHRRDWIKNRLIYLAKHNGIDVLGYAIMGNHMHVILRNRPDVVETWSNEQVARRIWFLFPKRKDKDGKPCDPTETDLAMLQADKNKLEKYRARLSDISWLMRQLAEHVAVKANKEDECTGRFWEGRFKSQPLLDEAAILACAAYVDLNPVRAAIAATPEGSDFTSVQDRIESVKVVRKAKPKTARQKRVIARKLRDRFLAPVHLDEGSSLGPMASHLNSRASDKGFLPLQLTDYLKLVEWTGREIVRGKKGRIPQQCKPILERLGLDREIWCELVRDFGRLFRRVAGSAQSLKQSAADGGVPHRRSLGGPSLLAG